MDDVVLRVGGGCHECLCGPFPISTCSVISQFVAFSANSAVPNIRHTNVWMCRCCFWHTATRVASAPSTKVIDWDFSTLMSNVMNVAS